MTMNNIIRSNISKKNTSITNSQLDQDSNYNHKNDSTYSQLQNENKNKTNVSLIKIRIFLISFLNLHDFQHINT